MHRILLLILVLSILITPTSVGCGGEASITIYSITGDDVSIMKAGTDSWTEAQVGMPLEVGDIIRSGDNSDAVITCIEGTTIELQAGTEIEIELLSITETGPSTIVLKQTIGSIIFRVIKVIDPASRYEIRTPSASVAVRGSAVQVTVAGDGTTQACNLEGDIWVIAQGVELQIPEGQCCTIDPGQPPECEYERVNLNVLIRTEDERLDIGDYVGDLLEDLGFNVTRRYGTAPELHPIWFTGDPDLGLWNAYTGGWVRIEIGRDEAMNFGHFYTPLSLGGAFPLWDTYTDEGDFYDVCEALWYSNFTAMEERGTLFEDALWMSMEDSVRVFLISRYGFEPLRQDVRLAADLAGGILRSKLWANTVHFHDGSYQPLLPTGSTTLRMATTDLLVDPWNPVAGTNWPYDLFPIHATGDNGFELDTNTGLKWPHRAMSAEVTWVDGLPIINDPDHTGWLTTSTVGSEIPVPGTAWYDFDATTGEFLTVADVLGSGVTALTKTVVHYPDSIWTVPMHDGSVLDESDFLLYTIMQFVRADPNSPLYDPSYVWTYDAFMSHFKGVELEFNPGGGIGLTVTTYDDSYQLDAELIAGDEKHCWFPSGDYGQWAWHTVALGILAEEDLALCFSHDKADEQLVEWCSFIDGPSLGILEGYLDDVQNIAHEDYGYIPFENVLGDYIDQTYALNRYSNLDSFYTANGNFWVATGPYYLSAADTVLDVIELTRHSTYPDDGDLWFDLLDPEPVSVPSHTGGWVDKIVITAEEIAQAIVSLQGDELDVYALPIHDKDLFEAVQSDPDLAYYLSSELFTDLTFNPVGPFFPGTGKLNPFVVPEIREALNRAIDREYICGTIMGGLGIPEFTCISPLFADATRYADILAQIEAYYAHDFDEADQAIEEAMLAIPGVIRDAEGRYWCEVSP
jgi:peptide/nickel transport system substrate-binding protein